MLLLLSTLTLVILVRLLYLDRYMKLNLDWRQLNEIDAEYAPVFASHESEEGHHDCMFSFINMHVYFCCF